MINKEFKDFIDSMSPFDTKTFDGELPKGVDKISATIDENIMKVYIEFDEHTKADTEVDMEDLGFIKPKQEILQDVYKSLGIKDIEDECESGASTGKYNEIEVKSNLYTKEDS